MKPRSASTAAVLLGLALFLACPGDRPMEVGRLEPGDPDSLPTGGPEFPWRQWGGPAGDFHVRAGDLAEEWPTNGPPQIWSRELGPGYSAIVYDRGVLFTIYRDAGHDVVIALRADDGRTIWKYRYPARTHAQNELQYGSGPNATPLIVEDRVITLGYGGSLHCLDFATGRPRWSLDLIADLDGEILPCGNSASPVRHGDDVIVLTGGNRQAVVALDPTDGSVVWRSAPGTVSYATEDAIAGIDAATGERLWSHPSFNSNRDNISNPIWGEDRLLWSSTQLEGGSRVIRLEQVGERYEPQELWASNRISIHYWNALRLGNHVYASVGSQGLVFACVDVRSGEVVWRRRGFEKANLLQAGDKTILLDADGVLALVRLTPEKMTVLSQVDLAAGETWTVPTLVGTTLYLRDHERIRALNLGQVGDD